MYHVDRCGNELGSNPYREVYLKFKEKKSKYSIQPYYNMTNVQLSNPIQSNIIFFMLRSIQNDPIITKLVWLHVDPHQKPDSNLEPP